MTVAHVLDAEKRVAQALRGLSPSEEMTVLTFAVRNAMARAFPSGDSAVYAAAVDAFVQGLQMLSGRAA